MYIIKKKILLLYTSIYLHSSKCCQWLLREEEWQVQFVYFMFLFHGNVIMNNEIIPKFEHSLKVYIKLFNVFQECEKNIYTKRTHEHTLNITWRIGDTCSLFKVFVHAMAKQERTLKLWTQLFMKVSYQSHIYQVQLKLVLHV